MRAQLCRLAMTAEIPEWKEIECPRDLSSVETGKAARSGFDLAKI
jgi:hypothetical protein